MNFDVVEKQVLYAGKKVRLELHHLKDDAGKKHTREICVHGGAVVILPVMDDGKVLLIRNYRYTVGQYLLELPAGTLEAKEDPMNCAGRELLEETGYLAGALKALPAFYSSPGILTEKMYCYVATKLTHQGQQLEEGEDIELTPMSLDEAIEGIRTGAIVDGKTIATLLIYDRFHHRAKQ
jgi:ADP-ribose pyrophosphatase